MEIRWPSRCLASVGFASVVDLGMVDNYYYTDVAAYGSAVVIGCWAACEDASHTDNQGILVDAVGDVPSMD
jgi:hypothetical protein